MTSSTNNWNSFKQSISLSDINCTRFKTYFMCTWRQNQARYAAMIMMLKGQDFRKIGK